MLAIGLTGAAASGKSTVAGFFAEAGAAVFDADRVVHALYRAEAAPLVEAAFPGVTVAGAVDRKLLGRQLTSDEALKKLEAIVHRLVRQREAAFLEMAARSGRRLAVLDIPLLFETGGGDRVAAVVVTSAPDAVRMERLRARGTPEAVVARLEARQMTDPEKRRRAHFIIETGGTLAATRRAVDDVIRAMAGTASGG